MQSVQMSRVRQMINYKCSNCGAAMESPSSMGGQEENCPKCGKATAVPAAASPAASASLDSDQRSSGGQLPSDALADLAAAQVVSPTQQGTFAGAPPAQGSVGSLPSSKPRRMGGMSVPLWLILGVLLIVVLMVVLADRKHFVERRLTAVDPPKWLRLTLVVSRLVIYAAACMLMAFGITGGRFFAWWSSRFSFVWVPLAMLLSGVLTARMKIHDQPDCIPAAILLAILAIPLGLWLRQQVRKVYCVGPPSHRPTGRMIRPMDAAVALVLASLPTLYGGNIWGASLGIAILNRLEYAYNPRKVKILAVLSVVIGFLLPVVCLVALRSAVLSMLSTAPS